MEPKLFETALVIAYVTGRGTIAMSYHDLEDISYHAGSKDNIINQYPWLADIDQNSDFNVFIWQVDNVVKTYGDTLLVETLPPDRAYEPDILTFLTA